MLEEDNVQRSQTEIGISLCDINGEREREREYVCETEVV